MRSKLIDEQGGARTFVLVFGHGESVMEPLLGFLRVRSIGAARLTAIGALESVTLGYFDWDSKEYEQRVIEEQTELLSLTGDVALQDGEPQVHAHVVVGRRDGTAWGGHLMDAVVRPTLELIIEDAPVHLRKRIDAETGLALIDPAA
jgi:predicted DNA-binding protein with PD1-like motif